MITGHSKDSDEESHIAAGQDDAVRVGQQPILAPPSNHDANGQDQRVKHRH